MTLQKPRGLRLLSSYRKRNNAAALKSAVHYAPEQSADPPRQSRAPDYLVYEVLPGAAKHRLPLVGRGKGLHGGDLHVLLNRALKGSLLLRPMWSTLHCGYQKWNRPPDYEVFQADEEGEMIGITGGAAWQQTGGAIFIKSRAKLPKHLLLRRVLAKLPKGGWDDEF